MKRLICLLLTLSLASAAVPALAEYYSAVVFTVNDSLQCTPSELEAAVRRHLFINALNSAAYGIAYDMRDPLNIIDVASKELFAAEQAVIVEDHEDAMGIDLSEEEEAQALAEARTEWEGYRAVVFSETAFPYLPAGDYERIEGDGEGNAARYLESFGVTESVLYREIRARMLEDKLMEEVTAGIEGGDEKIEAYTDLLMIWIQESDIREDGIGVAEVCLELAR